MQAQLEEPPAGCRLQELPLLHWSLQKVLMVSIKQLLWQSLGAISCGNAIPAVP